MTISRRGFLKAMFGAVAGAAALRNAPIELPPAPAPIPALAPPPIRGLPYLVANSGTYFDVARENFPVLKGVDPYNAGANLSKGQLERYRDKALNRLNNERFY